MVKSLITLQLCHEHKAHERVIIMPKMEIINRIRVSSDIPNVVRSKPLVIRKTDVREPSTSSSLIMRLRNAFADEDFLSDKPIVTFFEKYSKPV
jgi:hypothetical protein